MRVSIVTPSYNQAGFLEQTILSVLNQSYPDIEYIIMDGGSTDGSVDIIKKYSSRLTFWQSRKDGGQWAAINEGMRKGTGEVLAYLNSDDMLMPNAVELAVKAFRSNPQVALVYGRSKRIGPQEEDAGESPSDVFNLKSVLETWEDPIPQPSAFLRREAFQENGAFDESLNFCGDFEYWIRLSFHSQFLYLPEFLSITRLHSETKTSTMGNVHAREIVRICKKLIHSQEFQNSGLDEQAALRGAFLRASYFYRISGFRREAVHAYFRYCRLAFSAPVALYRVCRYVAGIILRTW